jgi:hypothetical protein
MYKLGYRINVKRHWRRTAIILLAVLIVAGLGLWYLRGRGNTVIIHASKPITTNIGTNAPATKTFDENIFTIDLPNTWKLIDQETSPYVTYTWQETAKGEDSRILTLYVDAAPPNYAVNRLLPVAPANNSLTLGAMSDDCSSFAGSSAINSNQTESLPNVPAKWSGVNFICNLSNQNDNIVGTGSPAGLNKVVLTGKTKGQHSFFFAYIDHTKQPDYSVFTDALTSFRIK